MHFGYPVCGPGTRWPQAIANDLRTNELGIRVEVIDRRVVICGEVASADRRAAVLTVAREHLPEAEIVDEIQLSDAADPPRCAEVVGPADEKNLRGDGWWAAPEGGRGAGVSWRCATRRALDR
jgi:hypothetical protein